MSRTAQISMLDPWASLWSLDDLEGLKIKVTNGPVKAIGMWGYMPVRITGVLVSFFCLFDELNLLTQAAHGVTTRQQGRRSRRRPVSEEWEILEGLKSGQQFDVEAPASFAGYIMKSRKWPMKGWHKVRDVIDIVVECCGMYIQ